MKFPAFLIAVQLDIDSDYYSFDEIDLYLNEQIISIRLISFEIKQWDMWKTQSRVLKLIEPKNVE